MCVCRVGGGGGRRRIKASVYIHYSVYLPCETCIILFICMTHKVYCVMFGVQGFFQDNDHGATNKC